MLWCISSRRIKTILLFKRKYTLNYAHCSVQLCVYCITSTLTHQKHPSDLCIFLRWFSFVSCCSAYNFLSLYISMFRCHLTTSPNFIDSSAICGKYHFSYNPTTPHATCSLVSEGNEVIVHCVCMLMCMQNLTQSPPSNLRSCWPASPM